MWIDFQKFDSHFLLAVETESFCCFLVVKFDELRPESSWNWKMGPKRVITTTSRVVGKKSSWLPQWWWWFSFTFPQFSPIWWRYFCSLQKVSKRCKSANLHKLCWDTILLGNNKVKLWSQGIHTLLLKRVEYTGYRNPPHKCLTYSVCFSPWKLPENWKDPIGYVEFHFGHWMVGWWWNVGAVLIWKLKRVIN